jgi:hypothetical protein
LHPLEAAGVRNGSLLLNRPGVLTNEIDLPAIAGSGYIQDLDVFIFKKFFQNKRLDLLVIGLRSEFAFIHRIP